MSSRERLPETASSSRRVGRGSQTCRVGDFNPLIVAGPRSKNMNSSSLVAESRLNGF